MKKLVSVIAGVLLLCSTIPANAITVDGTFGMAEWSGSYASDDGVGAKGYVGPGYGGQAFDVEYLGLQFTTGGDLYFGLQTGFNVAAPYVLYGGSKYYAGDFALDIDPAKNNGYEYAIDFTVSGGIPTYKLYKANKSYWQKPSYTSSTPYQYNKNGGGFITSFTGAYGSGIFSNNIDGGLSYVLEGVLDMSLLSLYQGGDIKLHWTMSCGNDVLNFTTGPTSDGGGGGGGETPVPEPGTFVLMAAGLVGVAGMVRRKRR